jgi:hypothetical protein
MPEVYMRSTRWARRATCALAISIWIPAALAGSKKSLADCTSFRQAEKGDAAIELSIHNSCKVPVDCSISWRVVCAPDAPKRRAVHPKSSKLTLGEGAGGTAEATAAICGDDSFSIDSIRWGCELNKD